MGVETLQQYVDAEFPDCVSEVDFKSTKFDDDGSESAQNALSRQQRCPQVLVVHADSCLRYLYPHYTDWICGGQWTELLNNVEKFVRSFRQANMELVVFFEGCLGPAQIYDWSQEQKSNREVIRKVAMQVTQRQFFQGRKDFVSPACLKTVLRLAFRACSVIVCSSVDSVHEEIISYCLRQHCLGVLAHNPAYLLYNFPNYFSSTRLKTAKRSVTTIKYEFDKVLQKLELSEDKLPLFASLLGNSFIPEGYLASFHWRLLDSDHPMKKLQMEDNLKYQSILPPYEIVVKGVAKYLQDKNEDDLGTIVQDIFNDTGYNLEEALQRCKSSVEYYKRGLLCAKSKLLENNGDAVQNGYPTHTFEKKQDGSTKQGGNQEHSYQERWKQFQQVNVCPVLMNNKDKENEKGDEGAVSEEDAKETGDNAANAIHQNNSIEGETSTPSDVIAVPEEKPSTQQAQWDQLSTQQHLQGLHGVTIGISHEEKPPSPDQTELALNGHSETVQDSGAEKSKKENSSPVDQSSSNSEEPSASDMVEEILKVARQRHQSGQMAPEVYNLLTNKEILLSMVLDDESPKNRPPITLLYRPIRQLIYGILFDQKVKDDNHALSQDQSADTRQTTVVKEWVAFGNKNLLTPDLVEAVAMTWDIPVLKTLWFGRQPEDNNNRMKAFLTCFKSDTRSMTNTRLVPQRFLLLCCILRYLIQQENKKSLISQHDIDALLAQALSPHLSIEHNSMNLANLKLNKIDSRPMYLASMVMSGVECAILANDACGAPVPWEFCCPWTFFDGKLFHTKWLQASLNIPLIELCDGKAANVETLERLRWVITEGLNDKFLIPGHTPGKSLYTTSPFGPPPASLLPGPIIARDPRSGGFATNDQGGRGRGRGRGYTSKRPVPNTGGTLQVAGMPVAHWVGNKGGAGKREGPDIVVGGLSSVDLPSSHRGKRGIGRGRPVNRGRGLLPTPIVQPWRLELDLPPTTIPIGQHVMPGGGTIPIGKQKMGIARSNPRSRGLARAGPNAKPISAGPIAKGPIAHSTIQPPKLLTKFSDSWVGKGRGVSSVNGPQSSESLSGSSAALGRGHWQE